MGIQNVTKALIKTDDRLWYIYSDKNRLEYRSVDNGQLSAQAGTIIQDVPPGFSADVDVKGHIHLICQSSSGEILYFHFAGQQWDKQVLTKYEPSRYSIKYPVIKLLGKDIHVFFAMGNLYNSIDWTLYHYFWHNGQWKTLKIGHINLGRLMSQFQVDFDLNGNIHIIYRDKDQKSYAIYHAGFDNEFGIWSSPEAITSGDKSPGYPAFLIHGNMMHIVWNNVYKNHICVEYGSIDLDREKNKVIKKSSVISPEGIDAMRPIISYADQKLWITWLNGGDIYSACSDDSGNTWQYNDTVHLPENTQIEYFAYIDKNLPYLNLVYGYMNGTINSVPPISYQQTHEYLSEDKQIRASALDDTTVIDMVMERISAQVNEIKTRQADLLQLLVNADRQYQQILDAIEPLEQLNNDIKAKTLHKKGVIALLRKWLSI
ncbi:hypothetical protein [Mahella australiensis]|uniref:Uncharacterized protein n=1 Tax=Mahella australiensis (strain DSM 15567 / CIP 107919 / 50-1 BON) TaxID=697281 RepID=F4A1P8_MAHA5|nr:hypothetical protein [Mahella australiensis]AEE97098.1 hypothetical protein Mahau_1922 [Mahella australiensis 50-1 BON]